MEVSAIKTQGRYNREQWVEKYFISWSMDGKKWEIDKETIFDGNLDQNTVILNNINSPITCRFIRIHPIAWHDHISLRFDVKASKIEARKECFLKRIQLSHGFTENNEDLKLLFMENLEKIKIHCPNSFGF